jgi:hypothetical protein
MAEQQADKSTSKAQGKQEVQAGGDYNAHAAYQKTDSPASAKQGVSEKTKYKHR